MDRKYIVKIDCDDEKGLVYKISQTLFKDGLNIVANREFVDIQTKKFFFRAEIKGDIDTEGLANELKKKLPQNSNILISEKKKKDIIVMCTKESHALGDILIKHYSDELNANILAVVSNYDILQPLVEKFDIPYYCVSHKDLSREEHEKKILEVLSKFDIDFIVLAKYMRILTPKFVKSYENRIINIHHSFLPAFIGANPYKQAYERGVKIIGATAHIVTDNLDEGPIIAQDIIRVDHTYGWRDMQFAGKNVEKTVLSNALNLALEDKIFINGNKTIIF
ncbi:MAG: formyltetrahydrofolate deformylase [Epsilonproteobacteria bacterium]|nr:formyltetrahydrofolate deformylase [Campylobacterota bacterium]